MPVQQSVAAASAAHTSAIRAGSSVVTRSVSIDVRMSLRLSTLSTHSAEHTFRWHTVALADGDFGRDPPNRARRRDRQDLVQDGDASRDTGVGQPASVRTTTPHAAGRPRLVSAGQLLGVEPLEGLDTGNGSRISEAPHSSGSACGIR